MVKISQNYSQNPTLSGALKRDFEKNDQICLTSVCVTKQSVVHLTQEPEVPSLIPASATFVSSVIDSRRAVVSYWLLVCALSFG